MSQLDYYRNIIPDKYDKLLALHDFRSRIKGRNKEPMNEEIEKYLYKTILNMLITL